RVSAGKSPRPAAPGPRFTSPAFFDWTPRLPATRAPRRAAAAARPRCEKRSFGLHPCAVRLPRRARDYPGRGGRSAQRSFRRPWSWLCPLRFAGEHFSGPEGTNEVRIADTTIKSSHPGYRKRDETLSNSLLLRVLRWDRPGPDRATRLRNDEPVRGPLSVGALIQGHGLGRGRDAQNGTQGLLTTLVHPDRLRPPAQRLVTQHQIAVELLGQRVHVQPL